MPDDRKSTLETTTPHSDMVAYLVERNYVDLGCDDWDSRKVQLLCAKFGDTPTVMAARLRHTPAEFRNRMETDRWTKQDRLILTLLEREIDAVRGGVAPKPIISSGGGS